MNEEQANQMLDLLRAILYAVESLERTVASGLAETQRELVYLK